MADLARSARVVMLAAIATISIALLLQPACSADSAPADQQMNEAADEQPHDQGDQLNDNEGEEPSDDIECATEDDQAEIDVAGTFQYDGGGQNAASGQTFSISGTISFEQQGNMVRVSDTTYDNVGLRRVAGEFVELEGNEFTTVLTPISGDTSYAATVRFVFTEDGDSFCVEFMDTNNDMGDLGSFTGLRSSP